MLPFQSFSPISAIVANGGEVLEGCMELALYFGIFLSICLFAFLAFAFVASFYIYSGNSTIGNGR
jgi:hypothetical protein